MELVAGGARRARRRLPLLPLTLVLAGLALIVAFFGDMAINARHQAALNSSWQHTLAVSAPPATPADPVITPVPVDGVDFAIRVGKIGYYAAVQEGVDLNVLASGPGHYPATPWPGQPGNVGVASHNTYWIKFADVQPGDEIDLETRYGTYKYVVTGSKIVWPDDRTALAPKPGKQLTLTTCWPLWAGAFAQQRLAIFASQVFPKQTQGGGQNS